MKGKRLGEKCAVITGGAVGIGRTTALSFGEEGAHVVIADLDGEHAEETAAEVSAKGVKARAFVTDVTARLDVEKMFSEAAEFMGGIDILVTCAGGYTKAVT